VALVGAEGAELVGLMVVDEPGEAGAADLAVWRGVEDWVSESESSSQPMGEVGVSAAPGGERG